MVTNPSFYLVDAVRSHLRKRILNSQLYSVGCQIQILLRVGKSRVLQKCKEGLTVASVCRLERSDIARAQLVCSHQGAAAPFKPPACKFSEEQIRHKAGVSTVAVREHINRDEAMMIAGSNLYRRVGLMLNLSANVAEHLT